MLVCEWIGLVCSIFATTVEFHRGLVSDLYFEHALLSEYKCDLRALNGRATREPSSTRKPSYFQLICVLPENIYYFGRSVKGRFLPRIRLQYVDVCRKLRNFCFVAGAGDARDRKIATLPEELFFTSIFEEVR